MGLFDGTPLERPVICNLCGLEQANCSCPPAALQPVAPDKQRLKIATERRKRGKVVTTVRGFECPQWQLAELLTELKNLCGAGGSHGEGNLEIQGDQIATLKKHLLQLGYRVS
ncbi:MAG: translation initiation factor [Pirellulaceae bacterium]